MALFFSFLTLQLFAVVIGGVLLLRRIERQGREIASLRRALDVLKRSDALPTQRATEARANVIAIPSRPPVLTTVKSAAPAREVAAPSPWRLSLPTPLAKALPPLPAATVRGAALGFAAT